MGGCRSLCKNDARGDTFVKLVSRGADEEGEASEVEVLPVATERRRVNFWALGAIPEGWTKGSREPPEGFFFAGGGGVVVQHIVDATEIVRQRVLLCLPIWAVDVARVAWFAQYARDNASTSLLCTLWRHVHYEDMGQVVLEFDHPDGESLAQRLAREELLDEAAGKRLCRDLLLLQWKLLSTPLWFGGSIPPTAVHLAADGAVLAVVPVACLLSKTGRRAAAAAAAEGEARSGLAPELCRALAGGAGLDAMVQSATDTYAAISLALAAMTLATPEQLQKAVNTTRLSGLARDLLIKGLQTDPAWRLGLEQALRHRWLRDGEPPTASPRGDPGSAL